MPGAVPDIAAMQHPASFQPRNWSVTKPGQAAATHMEGRASVWRAFHPRTPFTRNGPNGNASAWVEPRAKGGSRRQDTYVVYAGSDGCSSNNYVRGGRFVRMGNAMLTSGWTPSGAWPPWSCTAP